MAMMWSTWSECPGEFVRVNEMIQEALMMGSQDDSVVVVVVVVVSQRDGLHAYTHTHPVHTWFVHPPLEGVRRVLLLYIPTPCNRH
jgi:hypothetical protein